MTPETTFALIAMAIVFGGYAAVLGWALWYTRKA